MAALPATVPIPNCLSCLPPVTTPVTILGIRVIRASPQLDSAFNSLLQLPGWNYIKSISLSHASPTSSSHVDSTSHRKGLGPNCNRVAGREVREVSKAPFPHVAAPVPPDSEMHADNEMVSYWPTLGTITPESSGSRLVLPWRSRLETLI